MKTKRKKFGFLQLFLAMERDLIVGGQAVMEGVMMRTPSAYAIACRKKDGSIVHTAERLPRWSDRYKWMNLPVLRGGATLIQSMALGIKALNFSARIYEEDLELEEKEKARAKELAAETVLAEGTLDEDFRKAPVKVTLPEEKTEKKNKKPAQTAGAIGSIIFALGFNILLFVVAPLLLTNLLFIWLGWGAPPALAADASWWQIGYAYMREIKLDSFGTWVGFNLIDGLIRMIFFVIMIFSMSYLRDIRRVFEYHGAEHKTVFNWEKGLELTVENARPQRRQHPRCGTSFLMVVMLVSIVLFSVIAFEATWLNLVVRIALMPLVAGLSYEVIRYAAKKESGAIFKLMTMPGLWLQNITTQEPDDEQLEVAIVSLKESLKLEPAEAAGVPAVNKEPEAAV
jgi:Predicted metal-dependent enzyme